MSGFNELVLPPLRAAIAVAILFSVAAVEARAHDPGLSSSTIDVSGDRIEARLVVSDAVLGLRRGEGVSESPVAALDGDSLRLHVEGHVLEPSSVHTRVPEPGHRELVAVYPRGDAQRLQVYIALLERLPRGHKHHLRVLVDRTETAAAIVSAGGEPLSVDLSPNGAVARR